MGLFNRSKPQDTPKVTRPLVVQPSDLPGFSARLEATERAAGATDGRRTAAIRALSESAGGIDPAQLMAMRLDSEELHRPWRWFAKACELSNSLGQYELAPRVFIFTHWWKGVEGELMMGDFLDLLLNRIPADADRGITAATAEAIRHLPDDHVIAPAAGELSPRVGDIRGLAEGQNAA